jgi:hypothetical protein
MGLWEKHQEHHSAREAARRADQDAKKVAELTKRREVVNTLILIAEGQGENDPEWPLITRRGERVVSAMVGTGLFETRRGAGHWSGASAGVSVPTGIDGIRLRVGKTRGTYVQGDEEPTVIDTGNASITTQRIVFQGDKYTREWAYSKLIGVMHFTDHPATAIQVSNRQKTSGIVYPGDDTVEATRLSMSVAIGMFNGETDETIADLKKHLAELDSQIAQLTPADAPQMPAVDDAKPPASSDRPRAEQETRPPPPSPSWVPDPSGRHQLRYWGGSSWTDYVADDGKESRDPLPAD